MGCGASTVAPDGDIYKEKEMLPIAQGEDKAPPRRQPVPPARAIATASSNDNAPMPTGSKPLAGDEASGSTPAPATAPAPDEPLPPPEEHADQSTLFDEIGNGDTDAVQQLLDGGCPADVVDEDGNTPLHKAAEGESAIVRLLLDSSSFKPHTLRRQNVEGHTPLMAAIQYEDAEIVRMLVAGGATPTPEAIALARELDVPEVLRAVTNEDVADRVVKARRPSEDQRRVSVSGETVTEYTKMFKNEQETRRNSVPMTGENVDDAMAAASMVPEKEDED